MNRKRLQIMAVSGGVALVGLVAFVGMSGPADPDQDLALIPVPAEPPRGERKATADHEAVFKRAFWRRPGAGDEIKNAQLAEWAEAGGEVSRWQWFIEVEPSPALVEWLQQRNPFALVAKEIAPLPAGAAVAPDWFPKTARGFEIRQSGDGRMSLLFSQEENLLYATASGYGFAAGVSEPAMPVAEIVPTGRLPLTPPLNPQRR